MFRTVPLPIIRIFSLYTQQWYMSYRFAVCTVKNSWWWMEELSETCRVLFKKQILEISASSWFYYKNPALPLNEFCYSSYQLELSDKVTSISCIICCGINQVFQWSKFGRTIQRTVPGQPLIWILLQVTWLFYAA